jgi:hypothetical protein
MVFGAGLAAWFWKQEWTNILATLVFDNRTGSVSEDGFERHIQPGGAFGEPFGTELAAFGLVVALFAKGNSGESLWIVNAMDAV